MAIPFLGPIVVSIIKEFRWLSRKLYTLHPNKAYTGTKTGEHYLSPHPDSPSNKLEVGRDMRPETLQDISNPT